VVIVLIGNLWFHVAILRIIAGSALTSWFVLENKPLIDTDPGLGFLLFSALVLFLAARSSAAK